MKLLSYGRKEYLSYPVGDSMFDAKKYIKKVAEVLSKEIGSANINIWCRGSSGAILSALLCSELSNVAKICHIKKQGEGSHCFNSYYESNYKAGVNIIIDDFIASGKTLYEIDIVARDSVIEFDYIIMSRFDDDPFQNYQIRRPKSIICCSEDIESNLYKYSEKGAVKYATDQAELKKITHSIVNLEGVEISL